MTLKEVLDSTQASTLGTEFVVSISNDATVAETIHVLEDNHLQAVPVKNSDDQRGFSHFIDVLDIVTTLVHTCKEVTSTSIEQFLGCKVEEVVNASDVDPFITVPGNSAVSDILTHFANGVHRVAIVDESGAVFKVVSQWEFVKFLSGHLAELDSVIHKSVKDLGLVKEWVLFVRHSERAITSFKKMVENHVSGVAVVDEEGKFFANLSTGALRGLTAEKWKRVRLPTSDFLTAQGYKPAEVATYCCTEDDAFGDVINRLVQNHLHRVWVIDDRHNPIGVVSLTDLCALIKNVATQ